MSDPLDPMWAHAQEQYRTAQEERKRDAEALAERARRRYTTDPMFRAIADTALRVSHAFPHRGDPVLNAIVVALEVADSTAQSTPTEEASDGL